MASYTRSIYGAAASRAVPPRRAQRREPWLPTHPATQTTTQKPSLPQASDDASPGDEANPATLHPQR